MFNVRISEDALRKIAAHTSRPYEQIGLLLGDMVNGELVIFDIIQGRGDADDSTSVFSPQSLARIAQSILAGRVKGSIVGWYHSHVRGGVFMSETDVQTQLKLQQFSPHVVALVIDPKANEFGIFTYLQGYGVVQLHEGQITVY